MNQFISIHANHSETFQFEAEMRYSEYSGDYMAVSLDNGKTIIYLSPDQAQQLASHILSQLQAHRANELYKIQTEYAMMEETNK